MKMTVPFFPPCVARGRLPYLALTFCPQVPWLDTMACLGRCVESLGDTSPRDLGVISDPVLYIVGLCSVHQVGALPALISSVADLLWTLAPPDLPSLAPLCESLLSTLPSSLSALGPALASHLPASTAVRLLQGGMTQVAAAGVGDDGWTVLVQKSAGPRSSGEIHRPSKRQKTAEKAPAAGSAGLPSFTTETCQALSAAATAVCRSVEALPHGPDVDTVEAVLSLLSVLALTGSRAAVATLGPALRAVFSLSPAMAAGAAPQLVHKLQELACLHTATCAVLNCDLHLTADLLQALAAPPRNASPDTQDMARWEALVLGAIVLHPDPGAIAKAAWQAFQRFAGAGSPGVAYLMACGGRLASACRLRSSGVMQSPLGWGSTMRQNKVALLRTCEDDLYELVTSLQRTDHEIPLLVCCNALLALAKATVGPPGAALGWMLSTTGALDSVAGPASWQVVLRAVWALFTGLTASVEGERGAGVRSGSSPATDATARGVLQPVMWEPLLAKALGSAGNRGAVQEAAIRAATAIREGRGPSQPLSSLIGPISELASSPFHSVQLGVADFLRGCHDPGQLVSAFGSPGGGSDGVHESGAHAAILFFRRALSDASVKNEPHRYLGVLRAITAITGLAPLGGNTMVIGLVSLLDGLEAAWLMAQGPSAVNQVVPVAGDLLLRTAHDRGMNLGQLLESLPLVLEYVARHLSDKPATFHELADILKLEVTPSAPTPVGPLSRTSAASLAELMLPKVAYKLVKIGEAERPNLRLLAVHLGLGPDVRDIPDEPRRRPEKQLLVENLHVVLAPMFCETGVTKEDMDKSLAFLCDVITEGSSKDKFNDLLRMCVPKLFWEVLWLTAGDPAFGSAGEALTPPKDALDTCKRTLSMVAHLNEVEDDAPAPRRRGRKEKPRDTDSGTVERWLRSNGRTMQMIHYAGDYCDGQVPVSFLRAQGTQRCSLSDTLRAVRLLTLLISALGSHIGDVVPQFSALLTRATEHAEADIRSAALLGWATLVRALGLHSLEELARIASHVVVVLLPLLEESDLSDVRPKAQQVLEILIKDHGEVLGQDALRRLPPIEGLGDVSSILSNARRSATAVEQAGLLVNGLHDEALSVKLASLGELRRQLQSNRPFVDAILGEAVETGSAQAVSSDSMICKLISALLGCSSVDARTEIGSKVHTRCAECLGLLGAVDPAMVLVDLSVRMELSTDPNEFMKTLVQRHLVRLLRVSSGLGTLSNTMLAIQALLSLGKEPSEGRKGLFESLDENIQAVVKPFLSSKFKASAASRPASEDIIFAPAMEFRQWLSQWIRQLAARVTGVWGAVFAACRGALVHDVPLMLNVLPHAVYQALVAGQSDAVLMVQGEIHAVLESAITAPSDTDPMVLQAVFGLLDVLSRFWWWRLHQHGRQSQSAGTMLSLEEASTGTPEGLVRGLLDSIPFKLRAQASHRGGAHVRALLYFESHLREHGQNNGAGLNPASACSVSFDPADIAFLQRIWSKVEDPDGLAGVAKLMTGPPSPEALIPMALKQGDYSEAMALYAQASRRAVQDGDLATAWKMRQGQLQCMLRLGRHEQVLEQVNGLACHGSLAEEQKRDLAGAGVAASWRLSQWDVLEEMIGQTGTDQAFPAESDDQDQWEVRLGRVMLELRQGSASSLRAELDASRQAVMRPLSAASMESYNRVYPHLVKLHVLQEMEDAGKLTTSSAPPGERRCALQGPRDLDAKLRWRSRLTVVEGTLFSKEPILEARRQVALLLLMQSEAAAICLEQARISREAGHLEVAESCSLEAMRLGAPGAELEYSMLQWAGNKQDAAMKMLQSVLDARRTNQARRAGTRMTEEDGEGDQIGSLAAMHLASWKAETGQGSREEVTALFEESIKNSPRWWRPYFELARYADALMEGARARQCATKDGDKAEQTAGLRFGSRARITVHQERPWAEYAPEAVGNYFLAVKHGGEATYQGLPRMLTIFFTFGSHVHANTPPERGGKPRRELRGALDELVKRMAQATKELPVYLWLSCMPQLVSRVVHKQDDVRKANNSIVVRATARYPRQALWLLASSNFSQTVDRKNTTNAIVEKARSKCAALPGGSSTPFVDFDKIHKQLLVICQRDNKNVRRMSFSEDFPEVDKFLPADVLLPVHNAMTLVLPPDGPPPGDDSHVPFPSNITFQGVKDGIEILQSLMKPKKIRVVGSDGLEYTFLAKPKDDLRKDTRMMEMAGILNRVFSKDPASRQRNMKIRVFYVTPLTENSGIVEWVPRTTGLRHLCQEVYILDGRFDRR